MGESAALAPWRSPLSRALHRNRSLVYARYAQLATVTQDGKPANRTIVFRGFVDQAVAGHCNDLKFITDRRSQKTSQIEPQPAGELCWYFPKTREQFRLSGPLMIVGTATADTSDAAWQKLRRTTWHNLSDNARSSFAWPSPKADRDDESAFTPEPLDAQQPLDDFCLLLLTPIAVDHLELKGNPQNRCLYTRENGVWKQRSVNP
ncbi:pyridoxamine 5'-phosphate oxidase family protein [filamentous cyanobacterium LEGE 11480]|uniref:Pyridoxamine 5'-phosphate oxidase family protein n=1 Tax=Romeriopsis navalis LEGE 11480 TaxID=2777977 RepID=A0A928Z4D3_9CYAN|nr:Npun_F5749 family FMN-dependent PPOX-type flavoprotein [Romeriopsis navalis]MBE9030140.1 pyridoxamine 5'-phosphate oxidase family protein [Romeriopsis navalis LEGE 11480]